MRTDRACLARLAARGLRHRRIRRWRAVPWWYRLPAAEGEFDAAMAIEVLEHVHNVARFLSEIRRVVRRRACFSVPNLELLPMLADRAVAPWHVLEGDHRNFFSAPRLHRTLAAHFRHVEVLTYGLLPLRSPEGLPLHYHLFAIADV